MKELLITKCRDSLKWYSSLVGKRVPYLGDEGDHYEYRSSEPAGYVNFVLKEDAIIVEKDDE